MEGVLSDAVGFVDDSRLLLPLNLSRNRLFFGLQLSPSGWLA